MANLNTEQAQSLMELYQYRITALLQKIDCLEARLEIVNNK